MCTFLHEVVHSILSKTLLPLRCEGHGIAEQKSEQMSWVLLFADTQESDSEDRQAPQSKSGSRRQQLRKAFQFFTPGHDPKDKGGHLV